ncbi:hypothetical protein TNCV_775181 [Trichonephila clavipes]|nr:hypothetical protein TNCV_775181 [Trichonephila clavipes]
MLLVSSPLRSCLCALLPRQDVQPDGAVDLREYQCSKPATGLQVLPGKEHRYWSVESWKGVAWSDESRFLVLTADGRRKI